MMLDHDKIEAIVRICEEYKQNRAAKLYTNEETSLTHLAQVTFKQIENFVSANSNQMVQVRMYHSMQELMEDIEREKQKRGA